MTTTRVILILAVAGSALGQYYQRQYQPSQSTTTRQDFSWPKPAVFAHSWTPSQPPQLYFPGPIPLRAGKPCVPKAARADIIFGSRDKIGGAIALSQDCPDHPVSITGRIIGLNPNQKHGMHIHEFPNLGNACKDTGGHYNPFNTTHGAPEDDIDNRHVGDLGNIQADYNGVAEISILDSIISLFPGERNVVRRAVVIHAGEDDLGRGGDASSLRVGNAGGRLGCGVIAPNNDLCH